MFSFLCDVGLNQQDRGYRTSTRTLGKTSRGFLPIAHPWPRGLVELPNGIHHISDSSPQIEPATFPMPARRDSTVIGWSPEHLLSVDPWDLGSSVGRRSSRRLSVPRVLPETEKKAVHKMRRGRSHFEEVVQPELIPVDSSRDPVQQKSYGFVENVIRFVACGWQPIRVRLQM